MTYYRKVGDILSIRNANKSEKNNALIHTVFGAVLSVLIIAVGICFAASCIHIYNSDAEQLFTYESIGAHFKKIAIPVFLLIGMLIVSAVLTVLLPLNSNEKAKNKPNFKKQLSLLAQKIDISKCDGADKKAVLRERKLRKIIMICTFAVCAFAIIASLIFLLDFSRYDTVDMNGDIINACLLSLPLLIAALSACFASSLLCGVSVARELSVLRDAVKKKSEIVVGNKSFTLKECEDCCKIKDFCSRNSARILLGVRISVFAFAALFIVLGIMNGGMADVLGKAVRICTECIGLG